MQTMESLIRKAGYHGSARSVLKTLEVGLAPIRPAGFLPVEEDDVLTILARWRLVVESPTQRL